MIYSAEYDHQGRTCSFTVEAGSWTEAEHRLASIIANARISGAQVIAVPLPGPLALVGPRLAHLFNRRMKR